MLRTDENETWTDYEYPMISPAEFKHQLSTYQTLYICFYYYEC